MRRHAGTITILLVLIAAPVSQGGAQVKRQPYLQRVAPTGVLVRWDTDSAMTGTVHYGAAAGSLTDSASEAASRTKHQVILSGLLPAQKYYFSVTGPSGGSDSQYVVTAPAPGSAPSTRIWVASDFGQSNSASDNIRRTQTVGVWRAFNNNDLRADFMLSMGDQSELDADTQLQQNYFDQLRDLLRVTPLYTIAGNHEDTDGQVTYKSVFTVPAGGECGGYPSGSNDYYSFTWGNVHVVALTVEGSVSIDGAQSAWLQTDLALNTSDWLIAFMHRPMHSAGYHKTDGSSTALAQKANWLPPLEAAGVDLILAGHNHVYERSYMLDNLTGNSTDLTAANKIDTGLGRVDLGGAYHKAPGQPHRGTIFVNCEGAGTSNKASYLTAPFSFDPVVFAGDTYEGSLVIDVQGRDRMDVYFLCDNLNLQFSHIWDSFTIDKTGGTNSVRHQAPGLPEVFSVQNFPNPFNPSTIIRYTVGGTGESNTRLVVYDLLGREVAVLVNERKAAGTYEVPFTALSGSGGGLASGFYVCRLSCGKSVASTKMMLLQ